jgi:DNA gyrase/topoisomerase IV subunit B
LTTRSEEIVRADRNIRLSVGEMNAEQLWETTMNPATRKLKQLSIEDGVEASRLVSTLMGDDVPSRKTYIVEHADQALIDV